MYHSQPVAWVLAESLDAARLGAARVRVEYQELPAILTIEQAIEAAAFLAGPHRIRRGERPDAPHRLSAELRIGGQEHFYLETQAAIAWLDETGGVSLHSSTQHPSETQEIAARVLGVPKHMVTVECLRMGGAFGGKEVQANPWAAVAALGAWKTRRPVRVRLNRALDIALTGKRHPYLARYEVGFDSEGHVLSLDATVYSDGGWSLDLSEPVLWRTLFHIDNAYYLPAVDVTGYVCKTHKTSQTAFRGFGGPQGMLVIEDAVDRIARTLALPPELVRGRNLYSEGDTAPYGQVVREARRIRRVWSELLESSEFAKRRGEIDAFNAENRHFKRGIAVIPVKFGISFTATFFNQAGALVLVYRDGSVQVNHGGTEMGQGLHTKIRRIAAETLGIPIESVRIMPTRTDKVPNTSPTAASSGTDLNGAAVADACCQIKRRLTGISGATFAEVVNNAYFQRIPLFAQGYYRTPGIHFDPVAGRGEPFHYFAFGAAATEVEIDGFTGMHRIRRVDILQDVGDSVAPLIDLGQVEGGYIQGLGWLTCEELLWDQQGRVATAGASTYKLPSWSELPDEFRVSFLQDARQDNVIFGSKAVGEPPLMLAISAREALRDAIAAFGRGGIVEIDSPITPERAFWAVQRASYSEETCHSASELTTVPGEIRRTPSPS